MAQPTSIKFTDVEHAELKARAAAERTSIAGLIRRALGFETANVYERLDQVEHRVDRLEEMAGLA